MSKAIQFKNKSGEKIYPCPFYPVGSIYMSVSSTDPGTIFGGTWERIKGRFLLSADDNTYKVNATGGESTHKLTVSEMPSHNHTLTRTSPYGLPYNNTSGASAGAGGGTFYGESYSPLYKIENTGGDGAHNNMPPYLAVYMWKRVS